MTGRERDTLMAAAFILRREAGLVDTTGENTADSAEKSWTVPHTSHAAGVCVEAACNLQWRPS